MLPAATNLKAACGLLPFTRRNSSAKTEADRDLAKKNSRAFWLSFAERYGEGMLFSPLWIGPR